VLGEKERCWLKPTLMDQVGTQRKLPSRAARLRVSRVFKSLRKITSFKMVQQCVAAVFMEIGSCDLFGGSLHTLMVCTGIIAACGAWLLVVVEFGRIFQGSKSNGGSKRREHRIVLIWYPGM
jgi:hypothetical protein